MRLENSDARREWHIVTPLDGLSNSKIIDATANFVARCWQARVWDKQAAADQGRLQELLGKEEQGGWFDLVPQSAPRRVLRIQGEVWQALRGQLDSCGIELKKPRHARGYEVDAEILAPGKPLLVEIKTGYSAADFYCGLGQLMLYPALLPRLAAHTRVLLLPEGTASNALQQALKPLGVELHRYRLSLGRKIEVSFSTAFLTLCGVPVKKRAELRAF